MAVRAASAVATVRSHRPQGRDSTQEGDKHVLTNVPNRQQNKGEDDGNSGGDGKLSSTTAGI